MFTEEPLALPVAIEADAAPTPGLDQSAPAAEGVVAPESIQEPLTVTSPMEETRGSDPNWEWIISIGASALVLSVLALVLLRSLSGRGTKTGRALGWRWLKSIYSR